jgi:hypothetical protein
MIKLNAIIEIDIEYKRTIKLWLDLYHDGNTEDNQINRPVAVP